MTYALTTAGRVRDSTLRDLQTKRPVIVPRERHFYYPYLSSIQINLNVAFEPFFIKFLINIAQTSWTNSINSSI